MTRVETGLDRVATYLDGTPDRIELNQCQEELSDYKRDLAALYEDLVTRDIADDDELFRQHSLLERKLSGVSQKLKGMLTPSTTTAPTTGVTGVKLPKLQVPSFDGNLIHWRQFWDQFATAVDCKTDLSNAEKTVYLQQALKDGAVKSSIEGLSTIMKKL